MCCGRERERETNEKRQDSSRLTMVKNLSGQIFVSWVPWAELSFAKTGKSCFTLVPSCSAQGTDSTSSSKHGPGPKRHAVTLKIANHPIVSQTGCWLETCNALQEQQAVLLPVLELELGVYDSV